MLLLIAIVTKNPAGLIINGGVLAYGAAGSNNGVSGRAKATAKESADVLKKRCRNRVGSIELMVCIPTEISSNYKTSGKITRASNLLDRLNHADCYPCRMRLKHLP
jgi:hypothetical protein